MAIANDPRDRKAGEGMTTGAKIAMGCAIVAGAVVLLLVIAVVVVAFNAKRIAGFAMAKGADVVIDSSTLTPAEKIDAKQTIREFMKQTIDGKITRQKAESIIQELLQGAIGQMAAVAVVGPAIQQSDLSDPEKQDAMRNLQLLISGMAQNKVSDDELQLVLDAIPKSDAKVRSRGPAPVILPKQPPWTEEELRQVLTQIKKAVEGKDLQPSQTPPIPADELRKVIREMKEAMGKIKPAAEPDPEPAPEPAGATE